MQNIQSSDLSIYGQSPIYEEANNENISNSEKSEVIFRSTFDGKWVYNDLNEPVGIILSGGEWMDITWDIQRGPVQQVRENFMYRFMIRIFRTVTAEMTRIRNSLQH